MFMGTPGRGGALHHFVSLISVAFCKFMSRNISWRRDSGGFPPRHRNAIRDILLYQINVNGLKDLAGRFSAISPITRENPQNDTFARLLPPPLHGVSMIYKSKRFTPLELM